MNPILGSIISILILTALNGLFAGAEIAFVSIDKRLMIEEANTNNKKAQRVIDILEDSDSFLSTIQIAITLAGFLNSASAASNLSEPISRVLPWMPEAMITLLVTLIISYITLVLGELVPKRVAMQVPNQYAKQISGIISFTNKLFKPFIWLLNVTTNLVLRLLPINFDGEQPEYTRDEIRYVLKQAQEEDSIKDDEYTMLRNILKLDELQAKELKVHRLNVEMYDIEDFSSDEELINQLISSPYSRIPIYKEDKDNIIGVIHTKIFIQSRDSQQPSSIEDNLMPTLEVSENIYIADLLVEFQKHHIHLAILRDEYGGFEGIVTLEDVIEQIVGNIEDETDQFIEVVSGTEVETDFKSSIIEK